MLLECCALLRLDLGYESICLEHRTNALPVSGCAGQEAPNRFAGASAATPEALLWTVAALGGLAALYSG
jgi:hypothetical protein